MNAKNLERDGYRPVKHGGFFEEGDAIGARRHPIAGRDHVSCDLCHGPVDVVHQRRRRNAATQVDRSGDQSDDQVSEPALTCKNACVFELDVACIRHLFIH